MEKRMSDYTISIPVRLYEKAQRVAQWKSQPIEDVIINGLEEALDHPPFDLPEHEKDELHAMAYLSDDTLWTLAGEKMQPRLERRIAELLTKNRHGTISETEYSELESLVERGDQLTLRKSRAMRYLVERGHKITVDNMSPVNGQ
jgi:hypothetical protein